MHALHANAVILPPAVFAQKKGPFRFPCLAFTHKPVEKTPLNEPTDTVVSLYKTIETIIPREITSAPVIPKANKVTQKIMTKKTAQPGEVDEPKAVSVSEEHEPVETYEQYGQTYNVYNREKLYQEVWACLPLG